MNDISSIDGKQFRGEFFSWVINTLLILLKGFLFLKRYIWVNQQSYVFNIVSYIYFRWLGFNFE